MLFSLRISSGRREKDKRQSKAFEKSDTIIHEMYLHLQHVQLIKLVRGLSNKVSLDISLHLKKKLRTVARFREQSIIDLFRDFLQKSPISTVHFCFRPE
jgi:hypothetical protein